MTEIWKDIEGYEGLYKVSNLGNVKSLDRMVERFNNKVVIKGIMLVQSLDHRGYPLVNLHRDGKGKTTRVHRIVAQNFIDNPLNNKTVNHKNGNKLDNRVENLEWMTYKENSQHSFRTGLRTNSYVNRKVLMLSLDNKPLLWFDSLKEAQENTNIFYVGISKCCSGKNHTAGGYKWKYYEEAK